MTTASASASASASAPMLGTPLSPRRGGGGGGGGMDGSTAASASSASSSRRANIQVCVRLRPILPSDAPRTSRPSPSSSAATGSAAGGGARSRASRLPTPTKRGTTRPRPGASAGAGAGAGGGANANSSANSSAATARFARTTESASHRTDAADEPTTTTTSTSSNGTGNKLALIPAWEVTSSSSASPSSGSGSGSGSTNATATDAPTTDTIYQNPATNPDPSRTSAYSFDRVFGPATPTSRLYASAVSDVVRASMEGYHGSVFAYGQTSTGKTHTMTGTGDDPGIVPLAVRECFRYIQRSADAHAANALVEDEDEEEEDDDDEGNREYLLRVSYLEIYNESIVDLLAPPPVPGPRGAGVPYSSSTAGGGGGGIRIFESKAEGVVVRGLREEVVTSPEQVFALLATGEARRRTGSTALNRASSRSHSIFRLIVESRARDAGGSRGNGGRSRSRSRRGSSAGAGGGAGGGDDDSVRSGASASTAGGAGGPVRVSSLSLVDLAGSESVKASGASGARAKEGQFINKSLLTLGHVIYKLSELSSAKAERGALSMSTKHIPYRDSKLTRLLQPSLSGNAQICIICNVSPLERNLEESHNTLKFGLRAKKIKQNASINEVVDDRTLLQNYREEIEALKQQLREAKEAQATLQKERDEAVVSSPAPLDADDEDIQTLVGAIQNLEKLILRKATVKGTAEKPRVPADKNGGGRRRDHLDRTSSFFASGNFESLLIDDDDEEMNGDNDDDTAPRTPTTRRNLNKSVFEVSDLNTEANPDDDEDDEDDGDDGMITELHRIQALLGSVLKKTKSITTPSRPTMANAFSAQNTPNRDEEVELLRSQLKEQEVATSLRKADTSFLQSQLQEKDSLLQEVSKILDAVEKRQVELEKANSRMRQELVEKNATIEYQSRQIEKLASSATAGGKDDDEDLFDDLV